MAESGAAVFRALAAAGFVAAGVNHFVVPGFYGAMIPPWMGHAGLLVIVSGVAEIAGGVGLVVPRLRRAAAWGLIALLVAVFPANIYMALYPVEAGAPHVPRWLLWGRLLLQPVLMAWVAWVAWVGLGRSEGREAPSPAQSGGTSPRGGGRI